LPDLGETLRAPRNDGQAMLSMKEIEIDALERAAKQA
jgi:hypothetical protein